MNTCAHARAHTHKERIKREVILKIICEAVRNQAYNPGVGIVEQ